MNIFKERCKRWGASNLSQLFGTVSQLDHCNSSWAASLCIGSKCFCRFSFRCSCHLRTPTCFRHVCLAWCTLQQSNGKWKVWQTWYRNTYWTGRSWIYFGHQATWQQRNPNVRSCFHGIPWFHYRGVEYSHCRAWPMVPRIGVPFLRLKGAGWGWEMLGIKFGAEINHYIYISI